MDRISPPGVLIVRSGRNPHTICLALSLVAISLYGLVADVPSVSLDSGLTNTQRVGFGALSVIGAALILRGIYHKRILPGLLIERAGQVALASGATVYVIVLCTVSSFARSGLITTVACAIALGSAWRAWHISRHDLRAVRSMYDDQDDA